MLLGGFLSGSTTTGHFLAKRVTQREFWVAPAPLLACFAQLHNIKLKWRRASVNFRAAKHFGGLPDL